MKIKPGDVTLDFMNHLRIYRDDTTWEMCPPGQHDTFSTYSSPLPLALPSWNEEEILFNLKDIHGN